MRNWVTAARRVLWAASFACLGMLLAGHFAAAATVGPVTDPIGVIRVPKGAPIVIGGYWVLSGPDTALGVDEKRGAELAIKDVGGAIMGHPIKFTVEDDGCNAEGGRPRRQNWLLHRTW